LDKGCCLYLVSNPTDGEEFEFHTRNLLASIRRFSFKLN
jgi:hypothetical protein